MPGHLIVSISGVRNRSLADTAAFADLMDRRGIPLSLLVAPRYKHGYRLIDDEPTCRWLRERRAGADAVVLNGYDQASTGRRRAEFAVIDSHEAALRLAAADRILEQVGLRTRIFAGPRWAASAGALRALPAAGFHMNLSFTAITDLRCDVSVIKARVLGIGDGFPGEPWWMRVLIRSTSRTARNAGTVRLTVAASRLNDPLVVRTLLDCVDLAAMHGLVALTYRDILVGTPVSPATVG